MHWTLAIKESGADAFVLYASSDDADMRYLTRLVVHDPFVFFKRREQPGTIIVSQMEAERASRESPAAVITRTQAGLPEIIKTEKNPWKAPHDDRGTDREKPTCITDPSRGACPCA